MHVTKLNVQKKQRMKKSQQHINLRMSSKLSTLVLNSITYIKTPIMSRIMTKPTEWIMHPAIVVGLTAVSIPQTDWALR